MENVTKVPVAGVKNAQGHRVASYAYVRPFEWLHTRCRPPKSLRAMIDNNVPKNIFPNYLHDFLRDI
jgi:hypothetical protein